MKKYSIQDLENTYKELGIKKNDSLFIHSSIFQLGMINDEDIKNLSKNILLSLEKCVGKNGNLFFPAYFHDYSKKNKQFHLLNSPPCISLGSLPKYVFLNKKFNRSKSPLTSIIGLGPKSKNICNFSNFSSYGINSVWDKLLDINVKFLFLGTNLANSFTLIHHMEFLHGVPHMYIKQFSQKVINKKNKILVNKIYSYVRYLDYNINTNLEKYQKDLIENRYLKYLKVGSGKISIIDGNTALKFGLSKLEKNKYYFLNNIPKFKKKRLPLI